MPTHKLDHSQWHHYFDRFSKDIAGLQVEIEVGGIGLGSQIESEWRSLGGITYDPKNDLLEILTEDVDHLINHPREIFVDDDIEGLRSVEVIDDDGNHQVIKLMNPLPLEKHP